MIFVNHTSTSFRSRILLGLSISLAQPPTLYPLDEYEYSIIPSRYGIFKRSSPSHPFPFSDGAYKFVLIRNVGGRPLRPSEPRGCVLGVFGCEALELLLRALCVIWKGCTADGDQSRSTSRHAPVFVAPSLLRRGAARSSRRSVRSTPTPSSASVTSHARRSIAADGRCTCRTREEIKKRSNEGRR